ncbi:hypothetical protein PC9H_002587 [Pleurotus ostreatus]|nr:uncharacterized protein PC9H_002587 [Pleurotus ostreatus]KAF7416322.1 hypothetical protein PC9H_002587 [Pleurotus ostreatus]
MASPQPELRLDNTLGALFLGNIGAAIFYGITSVQTYIYFKNCSRDSLSLRNSIWFLWVLDTVHLAFITHALYLYCVSNFANPAFLQGSIW